MIVTQKHTNEMLQQPPTSLRMTLCQVILLSLTRYHPRNLRPLFEKL